MKKILDLTRENVNKGVVEKFEVLIQEYLGSGKPLAEGLPSVGYFAGRLNLSGNYLGDDPF